MKLLFSTGVMIVFVLSILNARLAWKSTPKLSYKDWHATPLRIEHNKITLPFLYNKGDVGFVDKKTGIRIVVKYVDGYYETYTNLSTNRVRTGFFRKVSVSTTPPEYIFV